MALITKCDRCGATARAIVDHYPIGWYRLIRYISITNGVQTTASPVDLCEACGERARRSAPDVAPPEEAGDVV